MTAEQAAQYSNYGYGSVPQRGGAGRGAGQNNVSLSTDLAVSIRTRRSAVLEKRADTYHLYCSGDRPFVRTNKGSNRFPEALILVPR